jgi:hypothetical protein
MGAPVAEDQGGDERGLKRGLAADLNGRSRAERQELPRFKFSLSSLNTQQLCWRAALCLVNQREPPIAQGDRRGYGVSAEGELKGLKGERRERRAAQLPRRLSRSTLGPSLSEEVSAYNEVGEQPMCEATGVELAA